MAGISSARGPARWLRPGAAGQGGGAPAPEALAAAIGPDTEALGPQGWRRMVVGLLLGIAAGVLLALVMPRENERSQGRSTSPAPDG